MDKQHRRRFYGQNIGWDGTKGTIEPPIPLSSVPENTYEEIVTVEKVYTLNGQVFRNAKLEEMCPCVYIVQGLTKDG